VRQPNITMETSAQIDHQQKWLQYDDPDMWGEQKGQQSRQEQFRAAAHAGNSSARRPIMQRRMCWGRHFASDIREICTGSQITSIRRMDYGALDDPKPISSMSTVLPGKFMWLPAGATCGERSTRFHYGTISATFLVGT